ncbi:MAG: hypothetical protein RSF90_04910 [Pygmaiobacter sp.]
MKNDTKIQKMCAAALLCAIGILIPIFSPIKIRLEPMSFTLGSHVALFVAMFISPAVALTVCVGTTLGFFLGGFSLVVVLRAASQVVFVMVGAWMLQRRPALLTNMKLCIPFGLLLGVIHALGEVLVCCAFFFSGAMAGTDFVRTILLLVGVGTLVHSLVDMALAMLIYKPVCKVIRFPISAKL